MIDLTLLDSHLRVVGNDPVRTMYERSEISFFMRTDSNANSYIRLEYESNPMARLYPNNTTGDGVAFTSVDEITAYLSPIADGATSGGGSGTGGTGGGSTGGGGLTQAQTQAAVSSAINSAADIDTIITNLTTIAGFEEFNVDDIETALGDSTSDAGDDDVIGQLKQIVENTESDTAVDDAGNNMLVFTGTANNTSTIAVAANTNGKETLVHNKDAQNTLYIKLKVSNTDVATISASLEIPPKGFVTFFGYKATLPVMVLTVSNTSNVSYYIEQVEYKAPTA